MGNSYRKALDVDQNYLDEELIEQPQKFMDMVELAADAAEEKDDAADALDIIKAEVEDLIRSSPQDYGLEEKPKEGAIRAAIVTHKRVQAASKRLRKAKKNWQILEGAKKSFEQRKSMLSKLVDWKIAGFHSAPRIKKSTREKQERQASISIKEGMKKRRIRRR